MPFGFGSYIPSLFASSSLQSTGASLSRSIKRISAGTRIVSAGDDPAGLGMAENLSAMSRSAQMAMRNTNDGISVVQTADGAASEVTNILKRMRELALQSSSGTMTNQERSYANDEFTALSSEIDSIAAVTEFNGISLGNSTTTLNVQAGTDGTTNSRVAITLSDLSAGNLAVDTASIDLTSQAGAQAALGDIDLAIDSVNSVRSSFGAAQNRLESAYRSMDNYNLNLLEAESRIRDTDYAMEYADMAKAQIQQDATVAVLAQARKMNASAQALLFS